jgi:hypothetical protein
MTNENILNYLIKSYNELAYTHNYIMGYVAEGMVYGARLENAENILTFITSLDRASKKNGGTLQLKYKPNKKQVAVVIENATEIKAICSVDYLEKLNKETRHNRGQIFETLSAKVFGGYQVEKKNAKFTECGDIIVNNRHYQVKYLKATFTDERTIKNLKGE